MPKFHTLMIVAITQADSAIYARICFGAVTYLVATGSSEASLQVAEATRTRTVWWRLAFIQPTAPLSIKPWR